MNLKRLPIYLLVTLLVSSLAACVLPFNRPTQAPVPTQDNRVAMTLTAIQVKSQATAAVQPTSQPSVTPAAPTATATLSASPANVVSERRRARRMFMETPDMSRPAWPLQ